MHFRPTLWPTLITIPALVILVLFGYWQMQRLQWKTELLEELAIRSSAHAIELPFDARIPAEDLAFRKVTVVGHYMHEAEMHLLNRVRDGIPGINIFTPLIRSDDGGILLVNRGWVPIDWPGTPVEAEAGEPDVVEVTGVVRIPELPGWLVPENEPDRNAWYFIDLAEMARSAGILPVMEYYVFATGERVLSGREAPLLSPDPNEWRIDLPNNHLSYAITWFSLAGALLAIYVIYHTRRRDADED